MNEPRRHHDEHAPDPAGDAADQRLAEMLAGDTTREDLRHELQRESSAVSEDLLARLDALDFVQQVVGGATDVPARIGKYRIKGLLGRGGMGTVYLGHQEELERDVALKVLSPSYSADPTMRKRFRAEARATAALHHRHIVPIYDYGEAQGLLFFAMERVEGMSLDKHIAAARRVGRAPMVPIEAAFRFAGVADALGLAHRRRLLHRDVKPGNILVAGDGTLALTDFGLAKALDQASVRLTSKGGGFLGTLHYSSPEQALGDDLSPASDLYSLGVSMFEAVTGELPFAVKTTEALLQAILHGTPRRLREVVPKAPRDLEAVIDKLLSREPVDRYQDGEALARDLLRIRDGEPVHIRRIPLHVRVLRRARKNPGLAGAIVAAAVLLLVSIALGSVLRREKGQSLVSRHQNNLVHIATDIRNEFGPATGSPACHAALTGEGVEAPPPNPAVLQAFAIAGKEMPDDPQVAAMRDAYQHEALPAAAALLQAGRGFEALGLFTAAIAEANASRTGGDLDLAVELRLYGLYLGRGVANLTAAVARLNEARTDLALAAYLRPGALFPRALLDVLDVVQANDLPRAADDLAQELANAPTERRAEIGRLLIAAAGLLPHGCGNTMAFRLPYPRRQKLHEVGVRLVAVPHAAAAAGPSLAARLLAMAQAVVDRLSDPSALRDAAQQLRAEVARAVHPESPLAGYGALLQLVEQPMQRGPLVDEEGQPLSPPQQLAAWSALCTLTLPRPMAARWLPRFQDLMRSQPNLEGMPRVASVLHVLAGAPEAPQLVTAWIADSDGDPAAWLCRMQQRLRSGDVIGALDDGTVAVQRCADRDRALATVVALCDGEAAAAADVPSRLAIRALSQSFAVLRDGGGR
ncbi:MAG: serine/threonine-protein kinase [Planctomycetota bacterium]